MKGNEALAEAAIRAGCKCFFGYPITPQTELSAYGKIRRCLFAGRVGNCSDQHGAGCRIYRRACHDIVLLARRFAEGRGNLLHGWFRPAGADHQRTAWRSGSGLDPAGTV